MTVINNQMMPDREITPAVGLLAVMDQERQPNDGVSEGGRPL